MVVADLGKEIFPQDPAHAAAKFVHVDAWQISCLMVVVDLGKETFPQDPAAYEVSEAPPNVVTCHKEAQEALDLATDCCELQD